MKKQLPYPTRVSLTQKHFTLAAEDLALLNPNTRTCPVFRCKHDAELTKAIYRRVPVLIKEGSPEENPWGIRFSRMFDMANDSSLFRTPEQLEAKGWTLEGNVFHRGDERCLPLYEPRLSHPFDHRWATYNSCDTRDLSPAEKDGSEVLALPHYWVPADEITIRLANKWRHSWLLGFRNITNSTNERTIICSHLPLVAVGHNALLLFFEDMVSEASSYIGANLNSFILDYCARQKLMSASVNYFNLKQFPILPPQIK